MNYCSLKDAWGENNISKYFNESNEPSKKFNDFLSNEHFTNVENNNKVIQEKKSSKKIYSERISSKDISKKKCVAIFLHINHCKKCQKKMRNMYKHTFSGSMHNIIDENKDIIVLSLMGIFIALFFSLISNINKN